MNSTKIAITLRELFEAISLQSPIYTVSLPYFNEAHYADTSLNTYCLDHADTTVAQEFFVTTTIQLNLQYVLMLNGVKVDLIAHYKRAVYCTLNLKDRSIELYNDERENRHSDMDWNSLSLTIHGENVELLNEDNDVVPVEVGNGVISTNLEGNELLFLEPLEPNDKAYAKLANTLMAETITGGDKENLRQLMVKAFEQKLHEQC